MKITSIQELYYRTYKDRERQKQEALLNYKYLCNTHASFAEKLKASKDYMEKSKLLEEATI